MFLPKCLFYVVIVKCCHGFKTVLVFLTWLIHEYWSVLQWWMIEPCIQNRGLCSYHEWLIVAQSCPTLCNPVNCSLPGSSVHGIFQARILEWVAISFSRGSSPPGIQPGSPALQAESLPSEPPGKPHTVINSHCSGLVYRTSAVFPWYPGAIDSRTPLWILKSENAQVSYIKWPSTLRPLYQEASAVGWICRWGTCGCRAQGLDVES